MSLRTAAIRDLTLIRALPVQLGAADAQKLTGRRLVEMIDSPDHVTLVKVNGLRRAAFLAMQFLPAANIRGNFAIITYFAVDHPGHHWISATEIEEEAQQIARANFSSCLLSQCKIKSPEARRFFQCRDYVPLDNHYIKRFSYAQTAAL